MDLAGRIRAELAHRDERTFLPGPSVVPDGGGYWDFGSGAQIQRAGDYLETSSAFYACAKIRADQLTTLDLAFYDRKRKPDRTAVTTGAVVDIFDQVNPFWTFNRFMNVTELALCTWGESYAVFDRGAGGRGIPQEIWWVKPTDMHPVKDAAKYIKGFLLTVPGGKDIPFAPHEVLWLRHPNPNDQYAGLSPLSPARTAADIEIASTRANHKMHTQGVQLGGVVMPKNGKEMSIEQTDDLERAINRRFSGAENKHKWGILRHEYAVQQLGVTPKDAEFLGGLRWAMLSVARDLFVPAELLNDDKRTYENLDQAMRYLWTFACAPEARFIASEIVEQVLPMFGAGAPRFAEFDLSAVGPLREDQAALWERVIKAWAEGLIGIHKAHEILGLEFDENDPRKLLAGPPAA